MSRRINVNPDHYKVAGRERQGEQIVQERERQAFAQQRADAERWQARQQQRLPPWTPAQAGTAPARATPRPPAARPPRTKRKSATGRARATRPSLKPKTAAAVRPTGARRAGRARPKQRSRKTLR
jgi:hypothetical protein